MACGILVPWTEIQPMSPALQSWFVTIGPPGKSLVWSQLCVFAQIPFWLMCLLQAWCPPMTSTSGICQDLPSRSLESPTHLRPPTVTLLLKHFMVGISSWLCINLYWVIDLCVSMLFYTSWRQAVLVRICLLLLKEAYESLLNRGQRLDGCYLEFPLRKLRLNLFRQILVFCSFRSEFWIHLSRGWRGKSKLSTFILRKPQEVTWAKFGVA